MSGDDNDPRIGPVLDQTAQRFPVSSPNVEHLTTVTRSRRRRRRVLAATAGVATAAVVVVVIASLSPFGAHRANVDVVTRPSVPEPVTSTSIRGPWPSLHAAVAAYGPTAEACVPVATGNGQVAIVIHATVIDSYGVSRGELAEVLEYQLGSWRNVATLVIVPGTRDGGPPKTGSPPRPTATGGRWSVELTGATDFVVPSYWSVETSSSAVISNVGGSWHVVPFREDDAGTLEVVGTNGEAAGVHGNEFITGSNTCVPSCTGGTIVYQRWRYLPSAGAFTNVGPTFTSSTGAAGTTTTTLPETVRLAPGATLTISGSGCEADTTVLILATASHASGLTIGQHQANASGQFSIPVTIPFHGQPTVVVALCLDPSGQSTITATSIQVEFTSIPY